MHNKTVETGAGPDFKYPVTFQQFDSHSEAVEHYTGLGQNAEEVILGILNAAQKQAQTQGQKEAVRKALKSGDKGALKEAITDHQKAAAVNIIGAPRTDTGGVTKKKAGEMGVELARKAAEKGEQLSGEEMAAVMAEYGL